MVNRPSKKPFSHAPASAREEKFLNHLSNSIVVVIRRCDITGHCLNFFRSIGHRHPKTRMADHIDIVVAVAAADHLPVSYTHLVLGDSDNDLSMFTPEFGWTVAMGNAQDCLKAVAKYETKSNREDGVAFAIRKYAL